MNHVSMQSLVGRLRIYLKLWLLKRAVRSLERSWHGPSSL